MSESYYSRKHALECLRLEAECLQLARDVHSPALRSHFLRMAKLWPALAERGSIIPDVTSTRRVTLDMRA